jgi:cytochrome c peroxidase
VKYAVLALAFVSVAACSKGAPTPYAWSLPEGWVPPVVPDDNPMSSEKVTLGRYLFYDKRLSGNGTMSCSSCHQQALAFTDGKATPTGSTGQVLARGSMMLGGAAYNDYYGWSNPLLTSLEVQMQVPMFSDQPVELGISGHEDQVLANISADPMYGDMFAAAYPDEKAPYTLANIIRAIACFERTMFSANSPWDRWQNGDATAVSASAQAGYTSFRGEKFDCYHCHEIPGTFASGFRTSNTPPSPLDFRNDAIYNVGGNGGYPADNPGLEGFTGLATDEGKFRGPSLRNIMVTGPYFHDGSAATIDDAIANYTAGGRTITTGPYAGDGHTNPNRDPLVKGFTATDQELTDFKAFLASLTDDTLMTDPNLSDPFPSN